jgi:D-lyxose ketol-isomerase
LHAGDAYTVNPRVQHRFVGVEDSVVVEVMYVEYDHEDIIRLSLGHVIGEDDDSTD